MSPPLMLQAVALAERSAAILAIRDAIADAGYLLEARAFSGIAMSFQIELVRDRVSAFLGALQASDVVLDEASVRALLDSAGRADVANIQAMLAVTFRHGDPDLRHDVPKVPG